MSDEVIYRLQERQASQKFYYDQHAHVLPSLPPGEWVTVQNPRTLEWKPAIITNKLRIMYLLIMARSCVGTDHKYDRYLKSHPNMF